MRINMTRSSMPIVENFCEEIRPLWDSRRLTSSGEKHIVLRPISHVMRGVVAHE